MRASRAIYGDISGRLYDTIEIHLSPLVGEDCFWNGLWGLPYDKVKLAINIYASDPQEKAQLILLWLKVRGLAAILQQTPRSKSIEIILRQYNGHEWRQNTKSFNYSPESRCDHDHHAIPVPFYRIPRVRSITLADSLPANIQKHPDIVSLISDIDFLYDTELDTLPGRTTAMLRLKRFATWYAKPLGKLPYETPTLATIRKYPHTIAAHDPGLRKLRLRYNCFDTLRLSTMGRETDSPLYSDHDWHEWLETYPDGVPELSEEWLLAERGRVFTRLELQSCYGSFGIQPIRPRRWTKFWHWIETYCHRNWNVERVVWLFAYSENSWCTSCRKLGYREGCPSRGTKCFNDEMYEDIVQKLENPDDYRDDSSEGNYSDDWSEDMNDPDGSSFGDSDGE
ncbi:hypothetical protein BDW62DRAFT_206949 [Aspergillus aurantiobrunneus]